MDENLLEKLRHIKAAEGPNPSRSRRGMLVKQKLEAQRSSIARLVDEARRQYERTTSESE
jgi:hypothetical protein